MLKKYEKDIYNTIIDTLDREGWIFENVGEGVLQINCSDLPKNWHPSYPTSGILQFWMNLDDCYANPDKNQFRVLYHPEDIVDLSHDWIGDDLPDVWSVSPCKINRFFIYTWACIFYAS